MNKLQNLLIALLVFIFIAVMLTVLAYSATTNNRYQPIYGFQDERGVSDINNNFARVSTNMVMDRGANVNVVEASSSTQIAFSKVQDDVTYSVSVIPSWNTNVRVLQKTTTGFVIFHSSAPSGNTLDWTIVR